LGLADGHWHQDIFISLLSKPAGRRKGNFLVLANGLSACLAISV